MRTTRDLLAAPAPTTIPQTLLRCGRNFAIGLLIIVGVWFIMLMGALMSGCTEPAGAPALAGDKTLAAANYDARSKSSALFGTIGDRTDAAPEVKRMTQVGERINGAATPQDYDWAKAVAASDKATAEAVKKADLLAARVTDLTAKLAAAPSPEELAAANERTARVKAELDAFAKATARNGIIGAVAIILCAIAAWQFEKVRIFGWGVLGSFSLNLEPYIVKRVSESPVLAWVIGILIAAGGGFALFEIGKAWWAGRKAVADAGEDARAPAAGGTPALPDSTVAAAEKVIAAVEAATPGFFSRLWTKVRAWFAGRWAKFRTWLSKVFTISTPLA